MRPSLVWRGRGPFELKAACLALAAVIATPYVFAYDLPILAVPLAFLYRQRAIRPARIPLVLAVLGLAMVPYSCSRPAQSGLFASLAIGVAIGRRCWPARRRLKVGSAAALS